MKILLTILLFLSLGANATTYYVSAIGNDANSGTSPANAWKTLAKASSVSYIDGDIIRFKCGDSFYGTLTINAGTTTAAKGVHIGTYGSGAKPVFTGLVAVSSWTYLGGNLWESNNISQAPSFFNAKVVLIGNALTPKGRYPNSGWLTYETYSGTTSITDNELTSSPNWTGAEVVIRKNNSAVDLCTITGHSGTTITYSGGSTQTGQNKHGYFIQNDVRTLDAQNEWYFDGSTKKLKVYSTSQPATTQVAALQYGITTGKSYVSIDSIEVNGYYSSGINISSSAAGATVRYCDIKNTGGSGISLINCDKATISYNTLTDILQNGISGSSNSDNCYVGHNTLTRIEMVPGAGNNGLGSSALNVGGLANTVEYNNITDCGFIAIKHGSTNSTIRYNVISGHCSQKMDAAAIYRRGGIKNQSNIRIYNNIIKAPGDSRPGTPSANNLVAGIYIDDYESGTLVYDNYIDRNTWGIYFHNSTRLECTGNLVTDCNIGFRVNGGDTITARRNTFYLSGNVTYPVGSYLMQFELTSSRINTMGVVDTNYYCMAKSSTSQLRIAGTTMTVSTWKNTYPMHDVHSALNAVPIPSASAVRVEANEAPSVESVSLSNAVYKDVTGTNYNGGTLSLSPYNSVMLINTGNTVPVVTNQLPNANAGSDAEITLPTASIILSGSGTDADGSIASYAWSLVSGPSTVIIPVGNNITVAGLVAGYYTFRLTVTDNSGATDIDDVTVKVNAAPSTQPNTEYTLPKKKNKKTFFILNSF